MRDILKEAIMSAKIKWGTTVILVLATALAAEGVQRTGSTSKRSSTGTHTKKAGMDPALAAAAKPFVATGCDPLLWEHVYHLQRLQLVEKCISVIGTIHHVKKEADGDDHIQLTLDSQFAGQDRAGELLGCGAGLPGHGDTSRCSGSLPRFPFNS
jgi:hypothetical protein